MPIDVNLVSPNDISREGLAFILNKEGFNVLFATESIDENADIVRGADSITIFDNFSLTAQPGMVALAREKLPGSRVVVIADQFDLKTVIDCLHAGAVGYIVKSDKVSRIVVALRLVALGEKVVPSDFVDVIGLNGTEHAVHPDVEHELEEAKLSPRELDVLCCLMAGYPNKQIARKLDVCEATVKVHVKAILRKLNVRNRTQAALWANLHGINDPCHFPDPLPPTDLFGVALSPR
jgi:two-component system nitrate/nitrite response regulator NarL